MGATEIIFIFVIYLLLFGAKGIPSLAKTMGQAVRTFRHATEDIQREILSDDARDKTRPDFSNVRERQSSTGATMGDGAIPPVDNPSDDPTDSADNSTPA